MSNFQGYLLKFGDTVFPHEYLDMDACTSTPNQRTEADAWTDANNLLHRETYAKYRTKEEYQTINDLSLDEKIEIQDIMRSGLINEKERKYRVTYWNDETNTYTTGEFYVPDTEFKRNRIENGTIYYGPIRIALIEY